MKISARDEYACSAVLELALNYDSESPWAILLPHLAQLKSSAVMLQLRSAAELADGQSDKALEDVLLSLQLADKVRTEPCLITSLSAILVMAATPTMFRGCA